MSNNLNDLRVVSLNSIKVSVVWGFYDTHWLSLKQIGVEVSSKLFPDHSICEKRNVTKSKNRERLFFSCNIISRTERTLLILEYKNKLNYSFRCP